MDWTDYVTIPFFRVYLEGSQENVRKPEQLVQQKTQNETPKLAIT